MKWLRFRHQGSTGFGTQDGEHVVVHGGSMFEAPQPTGARLPLADIEWLVPCAPSKVIGLWNNFGALAEKNGWARPAEPLYFLKATSSLTAHRTAIPAAPADVGRVAYEGELAIVIGSRAQRVPVDSALQHVLGYTCANDVTAIEVLHRDPSFPQWARAKSYAGFGALGPVIDTDFDVHAATLRTRVAGRERQHYALADMLFGPAELVSRLSHDMTLEPGDVILCGTSLGVLPMKPGSEVEIEIDGLGMLSNRYG